MLGPNEFALINVESSNLFGLTLVCLASCTYLFVQTAFIDLELHFENLHDVKKLSRYLPTYVPT